MGAKSELPDAWQSVRIVGRVEGQTPFGSQLEKQLEFTLRFNFLSSLGVGVYATAVA